jgi:hypothetical protein
LYVQEKILQVYMATGNVVMSQEHYNEIMNDIKSLTDALSLLELKVKRYSQNVL